MKPGNQHIDEWLQQSAASGISPFDEAHWQQMKALLQPKKKRRFFWCWWVGLFVVGCAVFVLKVNKVDKVDKVDEVNTVNGVNTGGEVDKVNGVDKVSTVYKVNKANADEKVGGVNKVNTVDKVNSINTKTDSSNSLAARHKKYSSKNKIKTKIVVGETDELDGNALAKKKRLVKHKAHQQTSIQNAAVDSVNNETVIGFIDRKDGDIAKKSEFVNDTRLIKKENANVDTSKKIIVPKINDSTHSAPNNKSKKVKLKSYWVADIAASAGKIPFDSKSFSLTAGRAFVFGKNFSLQLMAASGYVFTNEKQVFTQLSNITRQPGTVFYVANQKTVMFEPGNSYSINGGLAFSHHYKKWELGLGTNAAMLFKNKSNILKTVDTFTFFQTQPTNVNVGSAEFNGSEFNGKKYLLGNVSIQYDFSKKWYLGFRYQQQLWRSTVEGIADDKIKRIAAEFFLGIKF